MAIFLPPLIAVNMEPGALVNGPILLSVGYPNVIRSVLLRKEEFASEFNIFRTRTTAGHYPEKQRKLRT